MLTQAGEPEQRPLEEARVVLEKPGPPALGRHVWLWLLAAKAERETHWVA